MAQAYAHANKTVEIWQVVVQQSGCGVSTASLGNNVPPITQDADQNNGGQDTQYGDYLRKEHEIDETVDQDPIVQKCIQTKYQI